MKHAIFILLFAGITLSLFAQDTDRPLLTKAGYLQKAKSQKITAWCLLGGGLVFGATGIAVNIGSPWDGEHVNSGIWMCYVGAIAVLTSIPVFISAGKNRRQAASFAFIRQPVFSPGYGSLRSKFQPAIQFKIGITKAGNRLYHIN